MHNFCLIVYQGFMITISVVLVLWK